ncbi:MAG: lipid-A-disaccharide synthase N-terminal domain-containing protein [Flammeovirgaceae bacterium]|nr:lipid-A-disaccharide synthase N-terminal domain-containing protein [Flammeovirgaceae bacterium]
MRIFLFLIYGVLRKDPIILLGQTLSFYIYIRNLQLKKFWLKIPLVWRIFISPLPFVLYLIMIFTTPDSFQSVLGKLNYTDPVLLIGGIGQLLLNLRYLYQWYYSEQANESLLPLGFWLISAVASIMVVYYGFNRLDPVLLIAQSMGFVAYLRNIYLSLSDRLNLRLQNRS